MRRGAGALLAAAAAAAAAAAVVAAAAGGGSCACAAAAGEAGAAGGREGGAHWEFMSGVGAGDSFSYRICDALYPAAPAALLLLRHQASPQPPPPLPHAAQPAREGHGAAAPSRGAGGGGGGGGGACYSVTLHVEAVVDRAGGGNGGNGGGGEGRGTGSGPLYVVRAEAGAPAAGAAPGAAGLLVVDSDRFSVRHVFAGDRPLAESLQRTVFWRDGWGGRVPLAYGEPAVELIRGVPSSALLVSGSRVSDDGGRIEYVASHGVRIAPAAGAAAAAAAGGEGPRWAGRAWGEGAGVSTLVVADGVGLPVSARIHRGAPPPLDHYAGRLAFEFELAWFEQGEGRQAGGRGEAWAGQAERPGPPARVGAAGGPSIDNPHYAVHGRGAAAG